MNTILYLPKTSCQWRMIPKNLPPTIHINKQSKEINKQETSTPNKRSKNTNILRTSNIQRAKQSVSLPGGFPRPPWRSVKKNRTFPVKNEKLFERSEFFSFREMPDFLASERQPAPFLFVSFSFVRTKEKRKALRLEQEKQSFFLQTFSLTHKEKAPPKVPPKTLQSPPPPAGETHAGEDCSGGNEAPPPVPDNR